MRLKIGELAKISGLSVRALHHYDAIGLLSPSRRTDAGARVYGREDVIRLHRIEALKQFGCGLAAIKQTLDAPGPAPVHVLRRQIAALTAQAEQAQRLSQGLQRLLDWVDAGSGAPQVDWLNTLEMMRMYQKHLSPRELDTLLKPGADTVQPTHPDWSTLIDEVGREMDRGDGPASAHAQALAWRWMRLVIRMTNNDPELARKMMSLQRDEARAQDIVGITPAMFSWIGQAFAHARCTLFEKYMSQAQTAQVRSRQLAHLAHMDAWPALVAELRAQMLAGVAPQDAAVQDIVRRWQSLFRDSYCGDDAALEARVREAFMHEPDLRLGVGMDDTLLTYLNRAHVVTHDALLDDAGPKPSALLVAMQRAAHQLLETPRVLDDPLALSILGSAHEQTLRDRLGTYRSPMAQGLRSSVVVRSRLAEDEWVHAIGRGVRQYVVLGAGLDTSVYRHRDAPGRTFEVDLPQAQAWKQSRLRDAGIDAPATLSYVPVDFETVQLADGLARAGFDTQRPAFFSWLGVTMYLDVAAVEQTLAFIARCAPGSAVLFEFVVPFTTLTPMMRLAMDQVAQRLADRGEPWKSSFEPQALQRRLQELGFSQTRGWTADELNHEYLANRQDGLHIGSGPGRLMLAVV